MDSPLPGKDLITAYEAICRKQGAMLPVSPDYYRWFVELTDEHMSELLRLLILDRADEFNSWVFAEPRTKTDQDIYDVLETQLHLLALGFLQFNHGAVRCFAPLGPEPTVEEEAEITERICSSRALIRPAFIRILTEGKQDAPPKPEA